MYYFFLDKLLLPVTPSDLSIQINNKNETVTLINDGEINILKQAGLTEISFTFMIPAQKYPFASYYIPTKTVLDFLEKLKTSKEPFQFIVTRMNLQRVDHFTNLKVALESYEMIESADNGMDMNVSITLKQYKDYSTKKLTTKNGVTSVEKVRGK